MITSPFFTGFLQMSTVYTLVAIALLIAAIYGLKYLKDRRVSFSARMIVALVIGLALGFGLDAVGTSVFGLQYEVAQGEISTWYGLVGGGFLRLVQLLAVWGTCGLFMRKF